MEKILKMAIQVNLVSNPSETWRSQYNFSLLKFAPLVPFQISHKVFLGAAHFFYSRAVLDYTYTLGW